MNHLLLLDENYLDNPANFPLPYTSLESIRNRIVENPYLGAKFTLYEDKTVVACANGVKKSIRFRGDERGTPVLDFFNLLISRDYDKFQILQRRAEEVCFIGFRKAETGLAYYRYLFNFATDGINYSHGLMIGDTKSNEQPFNKAHSCFMVRISPDEKEIPAEFLLNEPTTKSAWLRTYKNWSLYL